ncbi:MAG: DUF420 domain-containing protein [Deltaproteobacteria bacterium]|nr:MAG: DUF420 domain-containing protein [Deltaproteobacteria bacterium]
MPARSRFAQPAARAFGAARCVRRGETRAHARLMTLCFALFLVAVAAFEAQVYLGEPGPPLATAPLVIHLCFAVPTLLLWIYQVATAKRALTEPARHRTRGRALMGLLLATVATGAWLYLASF